MLVVQALVQALLMRSLACGDERVILLLLLLLLLGIRSQSRTGGRGSAVGTVLG